MVWKNTTKLGCGYAANSSAGTFVVCRYNPAGNITNAGYFAANVFPKA